MRGIAIAGQPRTEEQRRSLPYRMMGAGPFTDTSTIPMIKLDAGVSAVRCSSRRVWTGAPHRYDLRNGSLNRNTAPPLTWLCAVIVPLCASIIVRAIDNPMPIPSALLVKNGSKTCFNLSSGMPGPRSDTDSWAKFSTREVRMLMMHDFARRVSHRLDPVHDKVQNDLLKLDAVAEDRKRIRCDHADQFELSPNGKSRKKSDRLLHNFIEVELFQFERRLFQKGCASSE